MNLVRTTHFTILMIAITYVLVITKAFLIPFIVAVLFWYIVREIREWIRKHKWVREKLPFGLQNILVFTIIFLVMASLANLISLGIQQFFSELPKYEANIEKINVQVLESFNFDALNTMESYIGKFDFTKAITPILSGLSQVIGDGFMIILYAIFLLLEESIFMKKTRLLFSSEEKFSFFQRIVTKVDDSFSKYIRLKTMVSLLTAVLSFIVLRILGVDSPILWSVLIFIFNYIPSIGSLIATAFPTVIAMLQFGEVMPGVYVLIGVGLIQLIVGNAIEPRVMGDSLNISPFVVIVALVVWGAIWGPVGMLLSVPITVMMIIIFAQFKSTKGVAIMLSGNGQV